MAKEFCVLYDDPLSGYRPEYARDDIPKIDRGAFRKSGREVLRNSTLSAGGG